MRDGDLIDNATPRQKARLHACRRLWQRRGIILSDAEYEAIVVGIKAGLYKQVATGYGKRPVCTQARQLELDRVGVTDALNYCERQMPGFIASLTA